MIFSNVLLFILNLLYSVVEHLTFLQRHVQLTSPFSTFLNIDAFLDVWLFAGFGSYLCYVLSINDAQVCYL